ncbi:hypothetical protein GGX14DRAFT_626139 [Mycena pura]|uniref:Uncharacterized protein n=1 Tax=Mycena pura TaxID=153505 RepID=A0AAD6VEP2_9AGAR|nr:hypothetical protein GGX14DRAFT_626139 [Mycena pura]
MAESSTAPIPTVDLTCPDPLEKIFQRVEEQNEARARQAEAEDRVSANLSRIESSDNLRKSRRRGSISITRFGQLSTDAVSDGSSGPMTPALSDIAAKSPFFQAHKSQNNSEESLASRGSAEDGYHQEDHHVTHVHTIAPRQSISRAAGRLIPRRLSRAQSSVLQNPGGVGGNVVIAVAAATVELPENAEVAPTVVHAPGALRNQPSKGSMLSEKSSWVTKVREFTKKFRRKSRTPLVEPAPPAV